MLPIRFKSIKNFSIPERQPLFFDEQSFEKLLSVIEDCDFKDLVMFAVNSGLREMELITLRWEQIDFKNMQLTLTNRHHVTKSKKVRTIPLNIIALQILNERDGKKINENVFTYNSSILKQDFVTKKFKKYIRKAKLNDSFTFHTCRHSFASWLVQRGASLYHIKELLGHQDISTSQIYSHISADSLRDSINLLT
ncbi:MAG: site-specific integrase [Bacteroidota bacterium]